MSDDEEELWPPRIRGPGPFLPEQTVQDEVSHGLLQGARQQARVWQRRPAVRQQVRAGEDDLRVPSDQVSHKVEE